MLANHLVQRLVALIEKGGVDLSTVQHLIIDEADRLFDEGCVLMCRLSSFLSDQVYRFVEQLDAIV